MFQSIYTHPTSLHFLSWHKLTFLPIPLIPATQSGGSRPPVPLEAGHLIRGKAAGYRSEATLVFL